MRRIPVRMPEARLIVTDDRIIPVGDVERAFGPKTDVDRPEGHVVAGDERGLLHGLHAAGEFAVWDELVAIHRVLKEPTADDLLLHRLRPVRVAHDVDAAELPQAVGLDDLAAVGQLKALQQEMRDAVAVGNMRACFQRCALRPCFFSPAPFLNWVGMMTPA